MGVSTSRKPRDFQLPAQRSDDLRARDEDLADLRVGDQIQIALAVADLHVFQAVPLLGHREQRLRQEIQMFDVDAQLAGPGAEQVALDADDVADIEQLVERKILFADRVLAHIDLQLLAVLHQMRETGLAHAADGHDAAGDAHLDARLQLCSAVFVAVFGQDLRDGVREIEPLAVRLKPERFNFGDATDALLVQIVFEGQSSLLRSGFRRQRCRDARKGRAAK